MEHSETSHLKVLHLEPPHGDKQVIQESVALQVVQFATLQATHSLLNKVNPVLHDVQVAALVGQVPAPVPTDGSAHAVRAAAGQGRPPMHHTAAP